MAKDFEFSALFDHLQQAMAIATRLRLNHLQFLLGMAMLESGSEFAVNDRSSARTPEASGARA